MIRTPQVDWCWKLDAHAQKLVLDMGRNDAFVTAYSNKKLTVQEGFEEAFTLEQTESYHHLADVLACNLKGLPEPVLFHMVIHAVAAKSYHKTIANKSWLFEAGDGELHHSPLVYIQTSVDKALGFVLSMEGGFATLLLLSETLTLPDQKSYERYTLIKTNINTLCSAVGEDVLSFL